MNQPENEQGSATILFTSFVILTFISISLIGLIFTAVKTKVQLQNSADVTAIAAANEEQISGVTCLVAKQVAEINEMELTDCQINNKDVEVWLKKPNYLPFKVHSKAGETPLNCP